jgi:Spy/CpxP family protein refolding chaperone
MTSSKNDGAYSQRCYVFRTPDQIKETEMKQSRRLNNLVAIALAATCSVASFTLLAADPKVQSQAEYPAHMGFGMMGGGYGMGPKMMGGYGIRPGMMGGRMGLFEALDLTDEQQVKINKIKDETRKSHWLLMGEMMDQQAELRDLYSAPKQDSAAIDKAYKKLGQLQQKMYETSVEAQKRIEENLTKEQQEKLRKFSRRGWGY